MNIKYVNFIIFIVLLIIALILVIVYLIKKFKPLKYRYKAKPCLLTNTELKYFEAFKRILQGTRYLLIPQVCLSSIIERKGKHKFQSELSRIVDFCIFTEDYKPILVIEINDKTHVRRDRKSRDNKVKYILKSAKIQLLTIWTKNEFNTLKFAQSFKDCGLKINLRSIYDGKN